MNAETTYASSVATAIDKVQQIEQLIADLPAPGTANINWANVGDTNEINNRLDAVLDFLSNSGA